MSAPAGYAEVHISIYGARPGVATGAVMRTQERTALETVASLAILLTDGCTVSMSYPEDCDDIRAWWRIEVTPATRATCMSWVREQQMAAVRAAASRLARAA